MTGYTVHTGSNDKFRDGWDQIFGTGKQKSKKSKSAASTTAESDSAAKKPRQKSGKKK